MPWLEEQGFAEIPVDSYVMGEADRQELEIQVRMYRAADRAIREEVEWLERHNFPVWIYHEGDVVDARTLPDEERPKNHAREVDLSKPARIFAPRGWKPESER